MTGAYATLYRGMDRAQLDAAYNNSAAMPVRNGIAVSGFYDLGCGSRWTGDEICWRHRPRHYAAIHFDEDDLYDCGWDTDFEVTVPDAIVSGVYGVRLRGGEQDIVPIYVLPPASNMTGQLVFLASTLPNLRKPPARQYRRCVPSPSGRTGCLSAPSG